MFNVLAAPGEVFTEIKERPVEHSNWLIPGVVWTIVGMAMVFLLFSQEWAMREISKAQTKAMEQQVAKGKMTQQAADQAEQMMKKIMPVMVKVGGSIATALYAFGSPFFWGFIIWFLGVKIFKADFEYMKAVEAAGLANIVYILTAIVSTLISLVLGKLTYLSLAFFLSEFDFTNKMHFAMAAVNPFYLWFAGVIASATAILSGVSWMKAAAWIFGMWLLTRALFILIGMGQFVM